MDTHFTYRIPENLKSLNQGDILHKTHDICELLEDVHQHYLKDDYKYFIVLTQSCDLVLRKNGNCKARYITLAAVRPLDTAFDRELHACQKHYFESVGGMCSLDYKARIYQFLEKVFNNNHTEYFYLHEDETVAFPESCCAFLRLSIAVRADEHYEKCLNAKFVELTEEFRAKLGWLVGNLYSRVGTKDWVPDNCTTPEFRKLINQQLERKVLWIEKKRLNKLKRHLKDNSVDITKLSQDEIRMIVEEVHIPSITDKKKSILKSIESIISKSNIIKDGANISRVISRIDTDEVFSSYFKLP